MNMRDYTKIEAWQLADDLAVKVYGHTKGFPREETFCLTRQIRDAASSVPANIAEGSARESHKEYLHFLYFARGSLAETQYLFISRNGLAIWLKTITTFWQLTLSPPLSACMAL